MWNFFEWKTSDVSFLCSESGKYLLLAAKFKLWMWNKGKFCGKLDRKFFI
jgi:hypothetical protein